MTLDAGAVSSTNSSLVALTALEGWVRDVSTVGCWFATVWLAVVICVTWHQNLYALYPAVTIRWVLYIDWAYNVFLGPLKWWHRSPLHVHLALRPNGPSCMFSIFIETFIDTGEVFLATIIAFSLYEVSTGLRLLEPAQNRRRGWIVAATFWTLSLLVATINVSFGYKVVLGCRSASPEAVALKIGVVAVLVLFQLYFVAKSVKGLFNLRRRVHALRQDEVRLEGGDDGLTAVVPKGRGERSLVRRLTSPHVCLPHVQRLLAIRFSIILVSEAVMVFPTVLLELRIHFVSMEVSPAFTKIVTIGTFLGPIIYGSVLFTHKKVLKALCKGN